MTEQGALLPVVKLGRPARADDDLMFAQRFLQCPVDMPLIDRALVLISAIKNFFSPDIFFFPEPVETREVFFLRTGFLTWECQIRVRRDICL